MIRKRLNAIERLDVNDIKRIYLNDVIHYSRG